MGSYLSIVGSCLLIVESCLIETWYFVYLNVLQVMKMEEVFASSKFMVFFFFFLKRRKFYLSFD